MDENLFVAKLWIMELYNRLYKKNANFILLVTGAPGTGKSYFCMALGRIITRLKFNINNMYFSSRNFMKDLEKINKGDVIVLEECGVNFSSRKWQSEGNIALGMVLQTIRFKNFGIILNLPNIMFLDVQGRNLLHYHCQMQSINYKTNMSYASIKKIEVDEDKGKIYRKFPRFSINEQVFTMKLLGLPKPNENLITQYEERKKIFSTELNNKLNENLDKMDSKDTKQREHDIDIPNIALKVKDNPRYLNKKGTLDVYRLMGDFNLSLHWATAVKRNIEDSIIQQKPIII
jgi:hypothetical protein